MIKSCGLFLLRFYFCFRSLSYLADIELIFFIATCMVLWLGFVTETLFVTIRCYWWVVHAQHWDFVFPHSPPTKKKSGKTLEVSRECNWGSWSNFTTGILPVIWCHKIYVKLVRKWIYFLFNSFFFAQYIFYWDCFICFKPVKFNFCPAPENSFSPSCKAR